MALVIVMREFDSPVDVLDLAAREDAAGACLSLREVTFLRSYVARDRRRMLCLYEAPDAESVREAEREARMPFTDVFSVEAVEAATLAAALAARRPPGP